MLYQLYDLQQTMLSPVRLAAETMQQMFSHPLMPMSYTRMGRALAAGAEMVERATRRYGKPEFGLGHTTIDGVDVSRMEPNELASVRNKRIGFVFQSFNLVKRTTVIKNVLAARVADMPLWKSLLGVYTKADKILALEALDNVGILEKAYVRADMLSGGQQQRVALARCLAQQPDIILADEPVASLDPLTSQQVMADFVKINRQFNITVVANMHHVDIATKYAKRIIGIKAGEIVFDGPSDKLTNDILTEIYGRDLTKDDFMGEA
jgi:phosphonate transport system ATP-binding protein